MNTPENTPEDNELIRAFKHYYWIVVHTNPILGGIALLEAPDSIKDLISKLQEGYGDVESGILSSLGTNTLLLRLVSKGIPLFKIVGKEISCVADIKKLWDELEIKSIKHDLYFYRDVCCKVMAYLEPQYLQIEKELMAGLEPEEQEKDFSVSTPEIEIEGFLDNSNHLRIGNNSPIRLEPACAELVRFMAGQIKNPEQYSLQLSDILFLHYGIDTRNKIRISKEERQPFDREKNKINSPCQKVLAKDLIKSLGDKKFTLSIKVKLSKNSPKYSP